MTSNPPLAVLAVLVIVGGVYGWSKPQVQPGLAGLARSTRGGCCCAEFVAATREDCVQDGMRLHRLVDAAHIA